MAKEIRQTRSNYVRRDPAFHFFLIPTLLLLLAWTVIHLVRHTETSSIAFLVIAVLMLVTAFKARIYAIKVQDRVIRLEERLRLSGLLPEAFRSRVGELTESQLIPCVSRRMLKFLDWFGARLTKISLLNRSKKRYGTGDRITGACEPVELSGVKKDPISL